MVPIDKQYAIFYGPYVSDQSYKPRMALNKFALMFR